ncbi:MAG: hydrogenase maturation nickel metallochaperone HypA [Eubacteriales bacterium]|nr:hydrogenase maturation nickel metallochaperone HypA [Eubacteriales bacterium]
MHEMGVVFSVVRAVESYAAENNISEVQGVVMEIGEVSSVIPHYFASCWEPAIASSKCMMNAKLEIEMIPGIARCLKCGEEFNIEKGQGKCEKCGSDLWQTISGRDVMIKEIYV